MHDGDQRSTWLLTHYDGNENKLVLLYNKTVSEVQAIADTFNSEDNYVQSIVELHEEQLNSDNVDWIAMVYCDGVFYKIRDLPVYGAENA